MAVTPTGGGPGDLAKFVDKPIALSTQSAQLAQSLSDLRIQDARWRLKARPRIGWTIIVLLIFQNVALVFGVGMAAINGGLKDLGPVIIGVTAATLTETAAIVQIVVKWLFSDINYQ